MFLFLHIIYVGYFTKAQIESKITAISAAIDAVMIGQSYSLDTGQGRQTVTRANLSTLQKQLDYWLAKHDELDERGGIISVEVTR